MVQISDQLAWELVKNNNCFLKKVNGRSKRTGTMRFSVETHNLRSLSSYKYSGISNSRAIGVSCTPTNTAVLSTKTASQTHCCPKKGSVDTPINKHFKKSCSTLLSQTSDVYYRVDLKNDAVAKYSKVYQANRIAKGVTKSVPVKKGRS